MWASTVSAWLPNPPRTARPVVFATLAPAPAPTDPVAREPRSRPVAPQPRLRIGSRGRDGEIEDDRAGNDRHAAEAGVESHSPRLELAHDAIARREPEGGPTGQAQGVDAIGDVLRRNTSISRVPVACPGIATAPRAPFGNQITVHPVDPEGWVQWPACTPGTAVIVGIAHWR
jgi:hypothetical protein